jgi:TPR repeat protein
MIREIPDSWQSVDLDPTLRRIAERAAQIARLPAEEWLERAIRRACPDDFRAPQPQSFAPRPTPEPPRPAERGLADLIAAARQVRQPAPTAAPRMAPPVMAPLPAEDEPAPSLSILDHMARKRRERGPEPDAVPEMFETEPRMTERRRGGPQNYNGPERRMAPPMPAYANEPKTDWQPALEPETRRPFAESPRDEFAEPLELDRPLRAKRSRKPLIAAVSLALIVALGALGAQRLLASHDDGASALNAPAQDVLPAPFAPSQPTALPSAVQLSAQMTPPPNSMPSPMPAPKAVLPQQSAAAPVAALPPAVSLQPEPMVAPAAPVQPASQPQIAMPAPAPTTPAPQSVVALGNPAPQAAAPAAPMPVTQPLPQRKAAATPAPQAGPSPQAVQNAQAIAAARKAAAGADGAPQDPAKLVTWLEERVKNNDPVAEYRLGVLYALGQGVKQDYGHAAQLFQAAADGGVAEAHYNIAVMYSEGMGAQKDPPKAVEWYLKAAAQGNANAAFNLGVAYSNGVGAKQDIQEAARWFRRAAGAGVVNAQFNLGLLYERGEGVPASLVEAYAWYVAAAAKGDQGAAQRRDHLASTFSPDDLKKAEARAAQLKATIQTGSATPTDQKAAAAH